MGTHNSPLKNEPSFKLQLVPETNEGYKKTSLDRCLVDLFEKRGSTREKALSVVVQAFRNNVQHKFVENKHHTILYQCLSSFKRGSTKEKSLASHAIALLALTVGSGDVAHQILEDSILPLSQFLESCLDLIKISSILDSLAIVTFVGGEHQEETERSLRIIWKLVHPKPGSYVVAADRRAMIRAAIYAWSFLLTTTDVCKAGSTSWQEFISYFSSILEEDDESLQIAAAEAIALLFELRGLEKHSSEAKGIFDNSVLEGSNSLEKLGCIQKLKLIIKNQERNISREVPIKKKNISREADGGGLANRDLFRDVLKFLEDGICRSTSLKIGGCMVNISTWSELIQLKFLKNFLGVGFVRHMQDNELLHDVFEFAPNRKQDISGSKQYSSNIDKVSHCFYSPEVQKVSAHQRMYRSPNSFLNKARAQLLKKQYMLSQARKIGHYADDNVD